MIEGKEEREKEEEKGSLGADRQLEVAWFDHW